MSPNHCLLRKGRPFELGGVHLVTFATHRRIPLFDDHRLARAAASAIEDARLWRKSNLLSWVLMPDHWHGIVHADAEPLFCAVQRLKCNVGRQVNLARAATGTVWDPAFHDRGLRCEQMQLAMARYIVMNPVRAGLVDKPGMYAYWNSVWL